MTSLELLLLRTPAQTAHCKNDYLVLPDAPFLTGETKIGESLMESVHRITTTELGLSKAIFRPSRLLSFIVSAEGRIRLRLAVVLDHGPSHLWKRGKWLQKEEIASIPDEHVQLLSQEINRFLHRQIQLSSCSSDGQVRFDL